ncbi:MAG: hypothetical protein JWO46_3457 [Nocardioidaceae bacterium]|nr:hypothetical protein [Nocardioidaceae bacterium]
MDHDTQQDTQQDSGETPEVDEQAIEEERQERLAPDNRPDSAEVDNTQRDFDPETGFFTDSDGADEAEPRFSTESELESGGDVSERDG